MPDTKAPLGSSRSSQSTSANCSGVISVSVEGGASEGVIVILTSKCTRMYIHVHVRIILYTCTCVHAYVHVIHTKNALHNTLIY